MKKMLLTLTTVGVLAVPAGMALAQSDTTEPAAPVPTCVDPVQDRDRDRDRDRTADQESLGAQDQVRTQLQTQLRTQLHLEDGTCDADCTGDQTRQQEQIRLQEHAQLADGTDVGAMHRMGEMGPAATSRGNG